jgi:hypothetical protein
MTDFGRTRPDEKERESTDKVFVFLTNRRNLHVPEEYLFDVFGRIMAVAKSHGGWVVLHVGQEGKRRRAEFEIPSFVLPDELAQYLDDIFHEDATPSRPCVSPVSAGRVD